MRDWKVTKFNPATYEVTAVNSATSDSFTTVIPKEHRSDSKRHKYIEHACATRDPFFKKVVRTAKRVDPYIAMWCVVAGIMFIYLRTR